ncbi:6-phosphofructokinase [Mycoplasma yeatsii]|uniref:ATP-dependent 6-phosphofructokinase n=1 Tax=Mycoplasma yeatsii TaxID=51365 RepID=A0ABU0NDI9_9MOLU|nr:6-phosphofructokinase [Mycoplasma yeatsii]MDQ0567513.1 6-phosphofructokinase 1 [Mycoplasma yeatsii]
MIKKIGILTSGGDAPAMNCAIAGVVKSAHAKGIEVYGIRDGYKGLYNAWFEKITVEQTTDIMSKGGTILGSARFVEFKEESTRKVAIENLKKEGIEALVVIGGDGSYMGAQRLTEMGINCVGLPGTIDNDIVSSDFTIGFDTALNTVVEAVDRIRDTMQSHNRACVVEIMGNGCGDLVTYAAVGTGAEIVSPAEDLLSIEEMGQRAKKLREQGKRSLIILISEKSYDVPSSEIAKRIEQISGFETRATILGHIQRGGKPTAMDRYLAFTGAMFAVDQLVEGKGGLFIGLENNKLVARDIQQTLNMKAADKKPFIRKLREANEQFSK